MRLAVLGPVEGEVDGAPVPIAGRLNRALLAALAVDSLRETSLDELVDAMWDGNAPAAAEKVIRNRVSLLRRMLCSAFIETIGSGYRLGQSVKVDVADFEDPQWSAARRLALWRGPAFAEIADWPPARMAAIRLSELHAHLAELAIAEQIDGGIDASELVGLAEQLVETEPFRERRWALLMRTLYLAGRQRDALRAFQRARALLRDELGVSPGTELLDAERSILNQDQTLRPPAPPRSPTTHSQHELGSEPSPTPLGSASTLPVPRTDLLGRADDLSVITALTMKHRLVTLTGFGGMGKTRLALAVAGELADRFPRGVQFVDLAPLTDGSMVGLAAVQVAGMSAESLGREGSVHERAAAALAGQDMLLVLDNCEHLLASVAEFVDRLLDASDAPRVLATSREALGIDGERLYRVSPLAVTDDKKPSPAVELFVQRSAATGRAVEATDPAVTSICRRLEGVPLAIELAASKMILMRPDELDARLGAQLTELTVHHRRGRHRSLEAVLDWSWKLLDEPVAQLLVQLGVFSGGWTLQAAEAVCDDTPSVAVRLHALVASSLVEVTGDTTPTRFRMLEPVRQFAVSRLLADPRYDVLRDRHLAWWLDHTNRRRIGEQWLSGTWARAVLDDFDNLRAAISWALTRDRGGDAAALIGASIAAWFDGPRAVEMDVLFDAVAAVCPRPPARFWLAGAINDMSLARHVRLADRVRTALRQSIDDGDLACEAFASSLVAYSTATIDAATAMAAGDAALRAARRLDDADILVIALAFTAAATFINGDIADALVLLREAANHKVSESSLASAHLHLVEFFVSLDTNEAGDPTAFIDALIASSPAEGMHQQVGIMCRAFDYARHRDAPAVERAVDDAYTFTSSTGYLTMISDAAVAAAELLESSGRTIPASTIIAALHRHPHSQPEIYHRYRRARQRLPPSPTPDNPFSSHELHQIVTQQLATLHSKR